LARRNASPWRRSTSATSIAGRCTSAPTARCAPEVQDDRAGSSSPR
jgi:hypothetical protein